MARTHAASPEEVAETETPNESKIKQGRETTFPDDSQMSSISDVVTWQVQHHQGFVKAFISSIRHGPIHGEHERWRTLGETLDTERRSKDTLGADEVLSRRKVLIICGKADPFVIENEIFKDAETLLGRENVELQSFDAGHEVPITHSREVARSIWQFMRST